MEPSDFYFQVSDENFFLIVSKGPRATDKVRVLLTEKIEV